MVGRSWSMHHHIFTASMVCTIPVEYVSMTMHDMHFKVDMPCLYLGSGGTWVVVHHWSKAQSTEFARGAIQNSSPWCRYLNIFHYHSPKVYLRVLLLQILYCSTQSLHCFVLFCFKNKVKHIRKLPLYTVTGLLPAERSLWQSPRCRIHGVLHDFSYVRWPSVHLARTRHPCLAARSTFESGNYRLSLESSAHFSEQSRGLVKQFHCANWEVNSDRPGQLSDVSASSWSHPCRGSRTRQSSKWHAAVNKKPTSRPVQNPNQKFFQLLCDCQYWWLRCLC